MSLFEIFASINLFFNIFFLIVLIVLLVKVIKILKVLSSILEKVESIVDDAKEIEKSIKDNIIELILDVKDIIFRVKGIKEGIKVGIYTFISNLFRRKN